MATCQAKDYGMNSSVALESKLATVIFSRSVEQELIFSIVIADGDDKSINIITEQNIYGDLGFIITSSSVSVASRRLTISQGALRDLCSFVFVATRLKQQPLHGLASLKQMNYSLVINIYDLFT